MAYLSLEIPPGVVKTGSQVESNGRWRDANLVRWHGGRMRPVGGWYAETSAVVGAPRSLVTWSTNAGYAQMFIGTNSRVYNWTGGTADHRRILRKQRKCLHGGIRGLRELDHHR